MYRIISVDLDGTLLSSKNTITEYTKEIIQFVSKKNYFVLASGRHYLDIMKIRDILKIKSFIISSNGAKIYNLKNEIIFNNNLDKDIALRLCEIAFWEKDIITQIYQNNQWYINNNLIENNFCSDFTLLKYKFFNLENLTLSNVSKIFFTSQNLKKLDNLKTRIISYWNDKVNINFSGLGCLEVVSGKTSKGYGLKLISNILGISLNNCISFGDGMNDKDMLSISGTSYIMKNADYRLKNILPDIEIIESNDNNGVAKCLNKIFTKK